MAKRLETDAQRKARAKRITRQIEDFLREEAAERLRREAAINFSN